MSCLLFTTVYLKRNKSISVISACKVDCEQSLIFPLNQSRSAARVGAEGRGASVGGKFPFRKRSRPFLRNVFDLKIATQVEPGTDQSVSHLSTAHIS